MIDLGFCVFSKREDGIILMRCKGHTYTAAELKEMLSAMRLLSNEQRKPFMFVAHEKSMLDTQALKYFSLPEATQYSSVEAYVLKSKVQKILANIYLSLSNTSVPSKAFCTEKDALAWLTKASSEK